MWSSLWTHLNRFWALVSEGLILGIRVSSEIWKLWVNNTICVVQIVTIKISRIPRNPFCNVVAISLLHLVNYPNRIRYLKAFQQCLSKSYFRLHFLKKRKRRLWEERPPHPSAPAPGLGPCTGWSWAPPAGDDAVWAHRALTPQGFQSSVSDCTQASECCCPGLCGHHQECEHGTRTEARNGQSPLEQSRACNYEFPRNTAPVGCETPQKLEEEEAAQLSADSGEAALQGPLVGREAAGRWVRSDPQGVLASAPFPWGCILFVIFSAWQLALWTSDPTSIKVERDSLISHPMGRRVLVEHLENSVLSLGSPFTNTRSPLFPCRKCAEGACQGTLCGQEEGALLWAQWHPPSTHRDGYTFIKYRPQIQVFEIVR